MMIPSMCRMLQCRDTAIFSRSDVQSAQILHPYISRLMGMAIKIRYLLQLLKLVSVYNLEKAPIDKFPAARCASIS